MICERCNTENLDGSQYCDECGALLGGSPRARTRAESAGPTENGGPRPNSPVPAPVAEPHASPARESHTPLRAEASSHGGQVRPAPSFINSAEGAEAGGVAQGGSGGSFGAGQEARAAVAAASAAPSAAPHAKLVIHRGRSVGKEFPLCEDETHIGRWDADGGIFPDVDLDADDPEAKVSRRHARITRRSGQYYVEDLGSTNGTFINRGRRLLPGDRHPLGDGDEVIVGKTFLRFHVLD